MELDMTSNLISVSTKAYETKIHFPVHRSTQTGLNFVLIVQWSFMKDFSRKADAFNYSHQPSSVILLLSGMASGLQALVMQCQSILLCGHFSENLFT
eukprot:scaffold348369_cov20-Prasinocladus_malaysianus.AAC.1